MLVEDGLDMSLDVALEVYDALELDDDVGLCSVFGVVFARLRDIVLLFFYGVT